MTIDNVATTYIVDKYFTVYEASKSNQVEFKYK